MAVEPWKFGCLFACGKVVYSGYLFRLRRKVFATKARRIPFGNGFLRKWLCHEGTKARRIPFGNGFLGHGFDGLDGWSRIDFLRKCFFATDTSTSSVHRLARIYLFVCLPAEMVLPRRQEGRKDSLGE